MDPQYKMVGFDLSWGAPWFAMTLRFYSGEVCRVMGVFLEAAGIRAGCAKAQKKRRLANNA